MTYVESKIEKPWKEKYELLKEILLQHKRPNAPWLILDCNGTVRLADKRIAYFGYDHEKIKANPKPFWEYLAQDIYKSKLYELSCKLDTTLARDLDYGTLQDRQMLFRTEHKKIRIEHGINEKVLFVDKLARDFERYGDKDYKHIDSKARILFGDGTADEIVDRLYLVRARLEGKQTYLGSLVVLGPDGLVDKFKSGMKSVGRMAEKALPSEKVHSGYGALIIDRLSCGVDVRFYSEWLSTHPSETLLLDFQMIHTITADCVKLLFMNIHTLQIDRQLGSPFKRVIFGNASTDIRKIGVLTHLNPEFVALQYPAMDEYPKLNNDLEGKLNELAERIRTHANPFPNASVSGVQPNPEGQGNDVQAAR